MKSSQWLAVLIFLLLGLVACKGLVIQGVDLGRVVGIGEKVLTSDKISLQEESKMGAQMTAILLGNASLHQSNDLQTYVGKVGMWVALQSERPDIDWHFSVINSSSINAFAAPGGYVTITSGLLDLLSNEAELAAVIAHEIAHVSHKHHLKAMEKSRSLSIIGDVTALAGELYVAKNPQAMSNDFYQNKQLAEQVLNTTTELYSKGLEREDEHDADAYAVTLLARSGYDPFAMAQVLQKLSSFSADDSSLQLLFNSHPKPQERLAWVESVYGQMDVLDGALVENRFNQTMGQVKGI